MTRAAPGLVTLSLLLGLACGDSGSGDAEAGESGEGESGGSSGSDGSEAAEAEAEGDGDGDGDGDTTGDGDGDTRGDGDGDTTGDGDGDTTGDGDGDTTGDGDGDNCLPDEIACDGVDEDCNGIVDDFDEGNDGFCDCYKIGIIGNKGSNPAANFEAWLEDKGTTTVRFGTMASHQLTQADLDEFDILIVDRLTHVYPAQEAAILQQWIEQGHGVISMAGYTGSQTDVDQQNSLVAVTGLSYAAPLYVDPVEVWQNHPVAEGAEGVQVYGGWQVLGAGEVFVRPQNEPNTSLGTAVELMDGAAIVFSDEWISFDSEWQMIPEVEVFWSNMIAWVGPDNICVNPR